MSATQWTTPNNGASAAQFADLLAKDGFVDLAGIIRSFRKLPDRTDLAIKGQMVDESDIHRIKIALKLKMGFR